MNRLQELVTKYAARLNLHELAIGVRNAKSGEPVFAASGQHFDTRVSAETPFFMASTTKLFATAIILQLVDEAKLTLDTRMTDLLDAETLAGLHHFKGRDYVPELTVRHLLAHTSGLADYFEQKPKSGGAAYAEDLLEGHDRTFSESDILDWVRTRLEPKFAPGTPGKALYSDTNFQLLGLIITKLDATSLVEAVQKRVAEPLSLKSTGLFEANRPNAFGDVLPFRNGPKVLDIPNAIQSTRLDGAGVSTAAELLTFIQAFFEGHLFDKAHFENMKDWRRIFFPLQNGTGIMRFKLPWFFSPFRPMPELWGHSGISGAFAYYCPEREVYLAGTINQAADRALPYRFMLEALGAA
ncbi:MAG: beta-lactamase family protein [Hyphomicrobiaceae bacterium]|nr:beta-lactamase family protein [Hyphomicrobiaceae bacterium]MCC0024729.1 beta-lactamase family protein [Hyphomicrobiaceae bacterium]